MCNHHNILREKYTTTCADCHINFDKSFCVEFTSNYNGPTIDHKSPLVKNLEKNFGICDVNLTKIVEKIFTLTSKNKMVKGINKRAILCGSLYYAYYYLENPKKFEDLMVVFSLDYKTASRGLKMCQVALQENPLNFKGQIHQFSTNHKEKLIELIKKYSIPIQHYHHIEKLIMTMHLKKSKILNDKINNLWLSCIFFWLIKLNPFLEIEDFVSIDDHYISISKLKSDLLFIRKHNI